MKEKIQVGIIGCGKISDAYFRGAALFEVLEVVACADINADAAAAKAAEHGVRAMEVGELLADPDVQIVINLTIPAVHAEVSLRALEAGKHVHCEKPLAVALEDGRKVVECAKEKGLLVGCAPDTFLGSGYQTCRKLIDDGWIGRPFGGSAFMQGMGPESWHPNPGFYYETGGGPLFDMGPYYLSALIYLMGPVRSLMAYSTKVRTVRTATCKEKFGLEIEVKVPTHYVGTLEFESGAIVTVNMSFDVAGHAHKPIEIYGTEGSLIAPDPNTFGGTGTVKRLHSPEWIEAPHSHLYSDNSRGIGVADMAYALLEKRPHRCNGDLAYHVLEIMHGFEKSSDSGKRVSLESTCRQPEPLPRSVVLGRL